MAFFRARSRGNLHTQRFQLSPRRGRIRVDRQVHSVGDPGALDQGTGGRQLSRNELPQREPFMGPPRINTGATVDVVERFADAVREWAGRSLPTKPHRWRGVESSGIGRTTHGMA